MEADEVLPVRSSTIDVRSIGNAELVAGGLDDADVGLVGDDQAMSSDAVTPAWSACARAESTMTRTARRKTSRPSIWM